MSRKGAKTDRASLESVTLSYLRLFVFIRGQTTFLLLLASASPWYIMTLQPVLIAGHWQASQSVDTFQAENPAEAKPLPEHYPISAWADIDAALNAAVQASVELRRLPRAAVAEFLEAYATAIEANADRLCEIANSETALPVKPRLRDVELPRTFNQLRLAAAAARDGSWANATLDTKLNLRACLAAIGPVWVFGPNNFPFAFNSIAGGDFAAAIAAGNPVIAKANTSHPGTTRALAELAQAAAEQSDLPRGTVQMIYRTTHEDGERLVADRRTAAIGYTGSRGAGLKLKAAADRAGKPIYLELSSINPVVLLPGALAERGEAIADEFATSCLMGTGQMCTNPGLLLMTNGPASETFVEAITQRFRKAPVGTLLSSRVAESLSAAVEILKHAGATVLVGGTAGGGRGHSYANTLLRVSGKQFLANPHELQTEAFGAVSLCVVADDVAQAAQVLNQLEGNLTGSIYSSNDGSDDRLHDELAPAVRSRVGRLLNDKMPTGVAVSPAMNHGGPYPATGHAGFTAVGIPAAIVRFAALECFDNVRLQRLPALLQNKNPTGRTWRLIDGAWSQADV